MFGSHLLHIRSVPDILFIALDILTHLLCRTLCKVKHCGPVQKLRPRVVNKLAQSHNVNTFCL